MRIHTHTHTHTAAMEQMNSPHGTPYHRGGLPQKNGPISSSIGSVATLTTVADEDCDEPENLGRVGSWVASFDKLLADPLGVQCLLVSVCTCVCIPMCHYIETFSQKSQTQVYETFFFFYRPFAETFCYFTCTYIDSYLFVPTGLLLEYKPNSSTEIRLP